MLTACKDELPNPHRNCVREILNALVCHDNDHRRITIELRNLQREFKQQMDKIEFRCTQLRRANCQNSDKTEDFEQSISNIDEMNECFTKQIEDLKNNREEILQAARKCLLELNAAKCKFKQFHEKTVDYLKRHAIKSSDRKVISSCEKDICEMHRLFVKEVTFIRKCENELQPFFKQLLHPDFDYSCNCCCFRDYEWLPKGKTLAVVEEIANNLKETMGSTLIKAFAQVHVHQPSDVKSFLAYYLMNLEHNEEIVKEKLKFLSNC